MKSWSGVQKIAFSAIIFGTAAICCPQTAEGVSPRANQASARRQSTVHSDAAQSARAAARELTGSVRMGDMGWMAEKMYPPLKKMLAQQMDARSRVDQEARLAHRAMGVGKKMSSEEERQMNRALETRYRRMGDEWKNAGVTVESFTVGEPFAEYEVSPPGAIISDGLRADSNAETIGENSNERSRIVILPIALTITSPDGRGGRIRTVKKSYLYAVRDESSSNPARKQRLNKWYFIDASTEVKTLRTFFPDLPLYLDVPPVSTRSAPLQ